MKHFFEEKQFPVRFHHKERKKNTFRGKNVANTVAKNK